MNKKYFITVILFLIASQCFSQITFDKGYFINEMDQRIDCLIKNVDWKNNPDEITYKLSEDGEKITESVKNIKEFAITGISKYVRANVEIDRSSNEIFKMSSKRNPEFVTEQLFLKVLVEGDATLYQFSDQDLERFFYSMNGHIKQLVYKRYKFNDTQVSENKLFQQQLFDDLNIEAISINDVKFIEYNKRSLVDYFIKYNNFINSEYVTYDEKPNYDIFNFSLKPGINYSRLQIMNTQSRSSIRKFDTEIGPRMGIEAEFILPFNKNKWGLIIEPAFQSYKSETELTKVNYESVEIPLGIRYYIFLSKNSKLFFNAIYAFDINSKNSLVDYNDRTDVPIDSFGTFAFGAGFKFYRFSSEFRYYANRELFDGYFDWLSEYNSFSIVFGITVF